MKRAIVGLLLLAGCDDDDCCRSAYSDAAVDVVLPQDANTMLAEVALVPAAVVRDLDVLFVIDDSGGMLDKQRRLQASVPRFFDALRDPRFVDGALGDALPSLHVGVVTTDMGTQSVGGPPAPAIGTCWNTGRDGVLQVGSASISDRYLRNVANADGTRTTNYTGSFVDELTAMTAVGNLGCGFQQPLAAVERALANPLNAGFVRDSARLAIILVSDGVDCSAASPTLFTTETSVLGPIHTFRCTRFGVRCEVGGQDPDAMNLSGRKEGCESTDSGGLLTGTHRYASRLASLKATPRDVLFAGLTGPATPINVDRYPQASIGSALTPTCSYDGENRAETAFPCVRVASLAASLPHTMMSSICDAFDPVMVQLAQRVRGLMGTSTCLHQPIALPATCEAVDIDASGIETVVPACTSNGPQPCIRIVEDRDACPSLQNLKVDVQRASAADAATWTSVRCAI